MASLFTHPALLVGLAALALPWVIEWLFRRRKRQIELPTIRFLLDNQEQKKVKRQDLLLLLLRTVAIILLVFAIARPLLKQSWVGNQRERHVFIILDATASMQQQVDVTTAFGLTQKKAAGVVRSLPAGSRVSVTMLTDRAVPVVDNETDLTTAAARIESLRPTVGAAPMTAALRSVKEQIARQGLDAVELYLFSDMQSHTWQRAGESVGLSQAFAELGTGCETFLVDVGGQSAFNYLVTMLRPAEFVLSAGKSIPFQVELQSRGKPPADARAQVMFLVDGDKKAVRDVSLGADPAVLEFDYRFPKAGEYLVEVVVDGDDYRLDNRRQYLCRVADDVRVLIIDDSADSPACETAFLVKAIRPPAQPGIEKPSHFDVKSIRPGQLSFENLSSHAAVVLTGTPLINETMAAQLERYVSDGGALLAFLNDDVNLYDYNKHLFKEGKGLLPAQLLDKASASPDAKDAVFPRYGETQHPAMGQFTRLAGSNEAAFLKWVKLAPAVGSGIVLSLSNGVPALVEKSFGRGRVLLANFTPNLGWSVLPVLPEYPILLQELLRYLAGNQDAGVNLSVGDRFDQPVLMSNQHLLLRLPDGGKQRLTPAKQPGSDDSFRVTFDETSQQGLYQIDAIEEVLARRKFVVNMNPEESELNRVNEAELRDLLGGTNLTWVPPSVSIEELAGRLHTVTELFPYVIGLLMLILAIESWQAFRFGRRRSGGSPA